MCPIRDFAFLEVFFCFDSYLHSVCVHSVVHVMCTFYLTKVSDHRFLCVLLQSSCCSYKVIWPMLARLCSNSCCSNTGCMESAFFFCFTAAMKPSGAFTFLQRSLTNLVCFYWHYNHDTFQCTYRAFYEAMNFCEIFLSTPW